MMNYKALDKTIDDATSIAVIATGLQLLALLVGRQQPSWQSCCWLLAVMARSDSHDIRDNVTSVMTFMTVSRQT